MRAATLVALAGLVLAAGLTLSTGDTADMNGVPRDSLLRPTAPVTLEMQVGSFDPLEATGSFGKRGDSGLTSYGKQFNPYRIVQFDGSVRRDWQLELAASGVEIVGYVPHNAYLVRVPQEMAEAGWKAPTEHVRWTGDYLPEHKFRDSLFAEVGQPELGGKRIRLCVMLFRGERADNVLASVRAAASSLSVYAARSGFQDQRERYDSILTEVDLGALASTVSNLARIPAVQWIEKSAINYPLNNNSIGIIQSGSTFGDDTKPLFDNGLTGVGQIIAIMDSGLDTDSCQFRYSADPGAQTLANSILPPYSLITNPENKVTTYYVMPGADEYDENTLHGTAVTGCVAGDNYAALATLGDPGHDDSDGMAPGVQVVMQDVGTREFSSFPAVDFTSQMLMHKQAYDSGARVHNNSWGGYSSFYDNTSFEVDQMIWRFNDYTVVFAAGNAGPSTYTLSGSGSTAKNTIVAGATEGSTPLGTLDDVDRDGLGGENVAVYSSHGPTWDFRFKPDIVAPGNVVTSAELDPIETDEITIDTMQQILLSRTDPPNNNCDTEFAQGTSIASPTVAGAAALVRQYFFDGYYPSGTRNGFDAFVPSGALVKAIIINSGRDLTARDSLNDKTETDGAYSADNGWDMNFLPQAGPIPTYGQGWGRVTLDGALYFPGDTRNLLVLNDVYNGVESDELTQDDLTPTTRTSSISTGETHNFTIANIAPGEPLKVTLAWSDPGGNPSSALALVNDLDLTVVSPSGLEYRGNIGFVGGFSQPATGGRDGRNNVENVFIENPEPGDYAVRVNGWNVPGSGVEFPFSSALQGYSLIATGQFPPIGGPQASFLTAKLSGGDGDPFLDPGERAFIEAVVDNRGTSPATNVAVTLSISDASDLPSPPLRLVSDVAGVPPTLTLPLVPAGEQRSVFFTVELDDWPIDYEGRLAWFDIVVEPGAGESTQSQFAVNLAKNVDTISYFDFDDGDLTEWILRQDGNGSDPPPGISECDTSQPAGRSGPKALKFGPLDDCDAEYSNNDKLVAISPPFPVALGQDLVSLNFFYRFNTEFGSDFIDVYLDRNGDGWFNPADIVTRLSGEGPPEMTYIRLPISSLNENRTDTVRVAFAFRSDASVTAPLGMIIDDISVTATSVDLGAQATPLVPLILDIEPRQGSVDGDTLVVITGQNFGDEPIVRFGTQQATVVSVEPVAGTSLDYELLVLTPPADTGLVNVEVLNPINGGTDVASKAFEYIVPRDDLVTLTVIDRNAAPNADDLPVQIMLQSASAQARPVSIEFTVTYDTSLVEPKRVVAGASVLEAGKTVLTDLSVAGEIRVRISGGGSVLADGDLVRILVDIAANAPGDGSATALECTDAAGENSAGTVLTVECIDGALTLRMMPGDLDGNGSVNAIDVQLIVNLVLAGAIPGDDDPADDNKDGAIDAVDIQGIVNRALGMYRISLSIDSGEVKQGDSVAIPVMLDYTSEAARPQRIQFSVQYDPSLFTARPVVPGQASMDAGMLVSSIISRTGYVDVTVVSTAASVGPGELVRLVFDVDIEAPIGTETKLSCTSIDAAGPADIVLDTRCSDGTLTVLTWRG